MMVLIIGAGLFVLWWLIVSQLSISEERDVAREAASSAMLSEIKYLLSIKGKTANSEINKSIKKRLAKVNKHYSEFKRLNK